MSKKISLIIGILKKLQLGAINLGRFCNYRKKQFERSPVQATFLIQNHMKRSNVSVNLSKLLPNFSHGARNYEIRKPRLPVHIHEYITGTCRYQLTVLLNEIYSIVEPLDPLKS